MTFIQTIPPNDTVGEAREMYQRQQDKLGYVPNYAKAFSHRPELMARWAALQSGIRKHVDTRRFELISFVAAHALGSSGCSLAYGKMLTQYFSPDDVQAIAHGGTPPALASAEAALVHFVRKVALDAPAVTAYDVEELTEHGYSETEIFDIVAVVAARAFFTTLLEGLGVAPDSRYAVMHAELRRTLTVRRPIDTQPPERIG